MVTALWANVHASFFFAPVIALLFAPGRPLVSQAAVVAALAPLLNPYGPQLYVHVFRYLTDTDLLSRIGEFQSFDFHSAGAAQIIATVILGVIGGTLALTQKRLHHFALAMLITAMALRSARALPLARCFCCRSPTRRDHAATARAPMPRASSPTPTIFARFDARIQPASPCPLSCCSPPGICTPAGAVPRRPVPRRRLPAHPCRRAPVRPRQIRRLSDLPLQRHPESLLRRPQRSLRRRIPQAVLPPGAGPPGLARLLGFLHFTHALLPADAPLLPALEQIGWRAIYQDKTATLLVFGGT